MKRRTFAIMREAEEAVEMNPYLNQKKKEGDLNSIIYQHGAAGEREINSDEESGKG